MGGVGGGISAVFDKESKFQIKIGLGVAGWWLGEEVLIKTLNLKIFCFW